MLFFLIFIDFVYSFDRSEKLRRKLKTRPVLDRFQDSSKQLKKVLGFAQSVPKVEKV